MKKTNEFALSSSCYGKEPLDQRFFEEAAAHGFNSVEIFIGPLHFRGTPAEIQRVRKTAAACGLRIVSVHCDMEILDPPNIEIFKKAKEVILANLDVVSELGAKILVIHSYIFTPPESVMVDQEGVLHPGLTLFRGLEDAQSGMLERAQEGMAYYAQEAGQRGVAVALETDTQKNEYLPLFIEKADPRHGGICFDSGHAQIQGDAVRFARLLAPRVICTHLHDNDGKKDLHLPPFKGTIDWKNLLMELVKGGYKGTYTFECHGNMADIIAARQIFLGILK